MAAKKSRERSKKRQKSRRDLPLRKKTTKKNIRGGSPLLMPLRSTSLLQIKADNFRLGHLEEREFDPFAAQTAPLHPAEGHHVDPVICGIIDD